MYIYIYICTLVNAFMSSRPKELIIDGTLNPPGIWTVILSDVPNGITV